MIALTKDEILQEIDNVETKIYYLDMKDRWSTRDYELDDQFEKRLTELKRLLKEKEVEK